MSRSGCDWEVHQTQFVRCLSSHVPNKSDGSETEEMLETIRNAVCTRRRANDQKQDPQKPHSPIMAKLMCSKIRRPTAQHATEKNK